MSLIIGHVEKQLDYKDKVNFKVFDVTTCLTDNCNTHLDQYLSRSKDNKAMKFDQLLEYNTRNIFLEKAYTYTQWNTVVLISNV